MVELITLHESLAFSAGALLVGLITMRLRRDLRRSTHGHAAADLMARRGRRSRCLSRYQLIPAHLAICPSFRARSVCSSSRSATSASALTFLFHVRPRRGARCRASSPTCCIAVALIVYALFRMNAVGVNLASIITTSAVLTGAIAFSLQATLGNLWGGIALQLDNTCRIGDWIAVDGVTGQVVGIRWRYTPIATSQRRDGHHSQRAADQEPRDACSRAAATSASRGGGRSSSRRLRHAAGAGHRRGRGGARARRDSATSPATRVRTASCTGFDDSAIKYVGPLLAHRPRARPGRPIRRCALHVSATLARQDMEIPLPRSACYLHAATPRMQSARGEREPRIAPTLLASARAVRAADRRRAQALAARAAADAATSPTTSRPRRASRPIRCSSSRRGRVGIFHDSAGGTGARDTPRRR